MKKPVIAIDGFSSTGKSSISKRIAEKLGLVHIDTGALYRAITLYGLQNYKNNEGIDLPKLVQNLDHIKLEFVLNNGELQLMMNGKNISDDIRSVEVSNHVSQVARLPEVRNYLLDIQRNMADNGGIIMDGRDIGTVIFPNADYKFFLTASLEERTRRRYQELKDKGENTDVAGVKKNLRERDKIDSEREIAPLKKADDAILIDNTHLNKEQTVDAILNYIKI